MAPPPAEKRRTAWAHQALKTCSFDERALKLLSASSPLITEGPGKDPTDLSHVKSSKYRQRKFLRNFNKQDRLINDFSCALVSDILLQGHLYISENYFAFHSNVFGYITKLLIPLSSVERVTKEKTAKIIPNAVGVVTFTHKYVFGSLLSRDTTFGIMTRVWKQHTPQEPTEAIAIQAPIAEDDSGSGGLNGEEEEEEVNGEDSSSGGGPADLSAAENETTCEPDGVISGTTAPHPDAAAPFRSSSATGMHQHQPLHHSHHIHHHHQHGMIGKSAAFVKGLYSKAMHRGDGDTAPHTGSQGLLASIACVPKITILLSIATILLILLFVAAGFMILRISNVQEQLLMSRAVPRNKMEIYQEVARWQKELHSSLASEVQLTVEKHLSNIAQVRASLDALYTLFPVTGEGLQSTSEPEKTSR
ncbi:unnamed protein product [Notodromas monacha]|uniref:GRAM domain-containing protein n=1 Tax=Notodromas monacha TaxID=399045 RepID=A0A7R9BDP7_9CRUS|nr:unnamed protein product [Notodromas monacha]CAG0912346.1 unnamed protein product [Notodromas monacha]